MILTDSNKNDAQLSAGLACNAGLKDAIKVAHATALIEHRNAAGELLWSETSEPNLKTNAGIDFLFAQAYGGAATASAALIYIALSSGTTVTETATSTTLTGELDNTNGAGRALATYAHTASTATCTLSKTFTATNAGFTTGKAALFTAATVGTMNHVLAFTSRTLVATDTLAITFTITIS